MTDFFTSGTKTLTWLKDATVPTGAAAAGPGVAAATVSRASAPSSSRREIRPLSYCPSNRSSDSLIVRPPP